MKRNKKYSICRILSLLLLLPLLASTVFGLSGCEDSDSLLSDVASIVIDLLTGDDAAETEALPFETETKSAEGNQTVEPAAETTAPKGYPDEDGRYTKPEDVALYLHTYGKLPKNFITKKEAQELGWDADKGNLWEVTDKMSIGGDSFGNREGLLPSKKGRKWYECDVNYSGGYRGGERIVYSNDGLIYYTDNHYESFTQLY